MGHFFSSMKKIDILYNRIVHKARQPFFYTDLLLQDTVRNRYELLMMHLFMALFYMKGQKKEAQALYDIFFKDIDLSLREMGISDLGVGRRIKALAQIFYKRIHDYENFVQSDLNKIDDYFYHLFYSFSLDRDASEGRDASDIQEEDEILINNDLSNDAKKQLSQKMAFYFKEQFLKLRACEYTVFFS